MLFRKTLSSKPYTPPPPPLFNVDLVTNSYDKTAGMTSTNNLITGTTASWKFIRAVNAAKRSGKWKFEFTPLPDASVTVVDEMAIGMDDGFSNGIDGFSFSNPQLVWARGGEVRQYLSTGNITTGKTTFLNNQRCAYVLDLNSVTKTAKLYNDTTLVHTFTLPGLDVIGAFAPVFAIYGNSQKVQIHSDNILGIEGDAQNWTDIPITDVFRLQGPSGVAKHAQLRAMANYLYTRRTPRTWMCIRAENHGKSTGKWAFEFTISPFGTAYDAADHMVGIVRNDSGNFNTDGYLPYASYSDGLCYVSGADQYTKMSGKSITAAASGDIESTRCAILVDLDSPTKTMKFYKGTTLHFTQELNAFTYCPFFALPDNSNIIEVHNDLILGVSSGYNLWY